MNIAEALESLGNLRPPPPHREISESQRILGSQRARIFEGLGCQLRLGQCQKGYNKLPVVPKRLRKGPRGGLFYITQRNTRVYINGPQKQRIRRDGVLPGLIVPPGTHPPRFDQQSDPGPFFPIRS